MVDLALTESQLELQGVARRFLRSHAEATDAPAPAGPAGQPPGQGGGPRRSGGRWVPSAGSVSPFPRPMAASGRPLSMPAPSTSELGRGPFAGPLFESAVLAPAIMLAADPGGAVFSLGAGGDRRRRDDRGAGAVGHLGSAQPPSTTSSWSSPATGSGAGSAPGPPRRPGQRVPGPRPHREPGRGARLRAGGRFGSVGRGPGAPGLRSRAVRGRVPRRSRRRHVRSRSETPGWRPWPPPWSAPCRCSAPFRSGAARPCST